MEAPEIRASVAESNCRQSFAWKGKERGGTVTPKEAKRLVRKGETLAVEFKSESRGRIDEDDLAEAVACLANRVGAGPAWLLLGVEDDGTISGAAPRDGAGTGLNRMCALIAAKTRPNLSVTVREVHIEGKTVLAIMIPEVSRPVATSKGVFLRRVHGGDGRPACHPMTVDDVNSLEAAWCASDITETVLRNATWDDLSPIEFDRFRQSVEERERGDKSLLKLSDLDLAKALRVVEANGHPRGIRAAALLLFGKVDSLRLLVPTHEVAFQELEGLDVVRNDFYRWPLLRIIEEFESRIRALDREQELMLGFFRVGVSRYAMGPLREAVANALMHRDYSETGATHVQWHKDRITVASPGGFPRGVGKGNLLVTSPMARNPIVANAFKRAGVVDQTARGIDMMYYGQLKNGHPPPSYFHSNDWAVDVSLAVGDSDLGFARLVAEVRREGREIEMDDLLVFHKIGDTRSITLGKAAALIQKSRGEARVALERLTEAGLVEVHKENGRQYWKHSSRTKDTMKTMAKGRPAGADAISRLERMVLNHVAGHGRITRGETAQLCHIDSWRATRLLSLLTEKGLLMRHGSKRGSHYVKGNQGKTADRLPGLE